MPHRYGLSMLLICLALILPAGVSASTGDIGSIIEGFVTRHFPDAASHFWVVNGTQWDGDEMIVDVNTVVEDVPGTPINVWVDWLSGVRRGTDD